MIVLMVEVVTGQRRTASVALLQTALGTPHRRNLRGQELEQAGRIFSAWYAVFIVFRGKSVTVVFELIFTTILAQLFIVSA